MQTQATTLVNYPNTNANVSESANAGHEKKFHLLAKAVKCLGAIGH